MYEFILGERPFESCERNDLLKEMLEREIKIDDQDKNKFSKVSVSFANKLLKNDPSKRLGANGIKEIKSHSFFRNFDWAGLKNRTLKVSF